MNLNEMTCDELAQQVSKGLRPVVTFTEGVSSLEGYAEVSMQAQLIGARRDGDDVIILKFDFEPFDEYNKGFETPNYYNKDRTRSNLTAREAGKYELLQEYYVMANDKAGQYFQVKSAALQALWDRYEARADKSVSYVGWLEQQVLAATPAAGES